MKLGNLNPLTQARRLIRNQEKVDRDVASLRDEVGSLRDEMRQALTQLGDEGRRLSDQTATALFQRALAQSAAARRAVDENSMYRENPRYAPAQPKPFEQYLKDLEALDPRNFPVWSRLFENGLRSYREEREASCSLWGNAFAEAFRSFVMLTGRGRLLDIGSGPYGLPMYLQGYPANMVSGIEPLDPVEPPDFELVKGFCEFLPWPDGAFDTVVSGTSLDHVLSLEKALSEIDRVLAPGGKFVLWIASVPGAKEYKPKEGNLDAIDEFHMFHFNEDWLEPMLKRLFSLQDRLSFKTPSFDHIFYSFEKAGAAR
jgi:SAM-dependent methyltransferase